MKKFIILPFIFICFLFIFSTVFVLPSKINAKGKFEIDFSAIEKITFFPAVSGKINGKEFIFGESILPTGTGIAVPTNMNLFIFDNEMFYGISMPTGQIDYDKKELPRKVSKLTKIDETKQEVLTNNTLEYSLNIESGELISLEFVNEGISYKLDSIDNTIKIDWDIVANKVNVYPKGSQNYGIIYEATNGNNRDYIQEINFSGNGGPGEIIITILGYPGASSIIIDWGDGVAPHNIGRVLGAIANHLYEKDGDYTVSVIVNYSSGEKQIIKIRKVIVN